MNIKKIFRISYWNFNNIAYRMEINYDKELYLSWSGRTEMNKNELNTPEWKYIRCFRKARANQKTLWGKLYEKKLDKLTKETGIWIPASIDCGKGLIIGHWGRIIVNPKTIIGDDFSISSGAVIGRDVRGKRKGTPVIGNRVCIKSNAILVGNIQIGDDVLIAPNAFVNFDVPSHSVVVGNPGVIHHRKNATQGHIGVVKVHMEKEVID